MPKAASRSQRSAIRGEDRADALVLVLAQLVLDAREAGVAVVEERREPARQDGEPLIGDARGEELVEVRRERELELAVFGEQLLPAAEVGVRVQELAQALAAVPHQMPAPGGVEREELGHVAGGTRSRIASSPVSNSVRGAFALNHRSPSAVGMRRTVDHQRTCGCSISPVRSRPCSASRASIQAAASASQPGCTQGGGGSVGTASVRPRA